MLTRLHNVVSQFQYVIKKYPYNLLGAENIPTITDCGSSTQYERTHIENWSPNHMRWMPSAKTCQFTVEKQSPVQPCTLVLDVEVLKLDTDGVCQPQGGKLILRLGPSQVDVCGHDLGHQAGQVKLSGNQG